MEITEVRIKLMDNADDRLQAFCSVTFDHAFVVRDLKIIGGANGPFVAMPSRKLTSHCPQCGFKNHLRAHYCNQCGARQRDDRTVRDPDGRIKLYADIAHPINAVCREQIQSRVLAEFRQELERSRLPGYVSRYDEDYDLDFEFPLESPSAGSQEAPMSTVSPVAPAAESPTAQSGPATPGTPPIPPPHVPRGNRAFGAGVFDEQRQERRGR
ncbi:MAG: septation protein SpoVG family protein [Planctomycetota bacterium]